ncbi:ABC transporter transmembrane domain-containing protein [Asticcacaulis sp.]|uniref:ABC transporter transmembrane domain-containing protein n=1 Tax=Asticcacaulis sp. TaxID=1872648 RepID=UPI00391D661B
MSVRRSFIDAAAFSGCLNVLMLSGSMFMLQVYDRVLPGHSLPTLQALVLLIIGIYGLIGVLELIRSRLFARIAQYVEANLSNAVFDQSARQALGRGGNAKSGLIRDLGQIRTFLSGGGPSALFDLPWTPLYVVLLFLLHPWLGVVGLAGILLLTALTWLTDRGTRGPQGDATKRQHEAHGVSEVAFTGAETVKALGMVVRFTSFATQSTPEALASIESVSSDVSTDERSGESFYTIRMVMNGQGLPERIKAKLTAGMPVEVQIETYERSAISYFLKPLTDQFSRAFREE